MHLLKSDGPGDGNGYGDGDGDGYGDTQPLTDRHLLLMLAVRRRICTY